MDIPVDIRQTCRWNNVMYLNFAIRSCVGKLKREPECLVIPGRKQYGKQHNMIHMSNLVCPPAKNGMLAELQLFCWFNQILIKSGKPHFLYHGKKLEPQVQCMGMNNLIKTSLPRQSIEHRGVNQAKRKLRIIIYKEENYNKHAKLLTCSLWLSCSIWGYPIET